MFIIVLFSWLIGTFIIGKCTSLSLVALFALKSIFSDSRIATSPFLWLLFAWYILFPLFYFQSNSIFNCLLRNFNFNLKIFYMLGCLFSECWVVKIFNTFWIQILNQIFVLQIFFLVWLVFSLSFYLFSNRALFLFSAPTGLQ